MSPINPKGGVAAGFAPGTPGGDSAYGDDDFEDYDDDDFAGLDTVA